MRVKRTMRGLMTLLAIYAGSALAEPDLTGLWRLQGFKNLFLRTAEGGLPPLRPEAAALYEQRSAAYSAGDLSYDNTAMLCVSPGMPRLALLPYPIQIIQRPKRIAFLYQWNNRHRAVDMTGKAPIDDLSYMGTASGRIEGDSVVIETEGFVDTKLLDSAGMPHSTALRLTERYRLKGRNTLVNEITIEDPQTFTQPWTVTATYQRMPAGTQIQEDVCRERLMRKEPVFDLLKWK